MMWQRCPGGWSAADLSAGGRVTGNANSEDRRGDILINDDAGKRAWVRTPDGTAHPLRALPGSAGVYARQINDRGWIAGAVYGPAPGFLTTGTLWKGYRAAPLAVHPLPFPGSDDATLLGLDDRGDAVGNSDNADFSDGAGGVWRAGSPNGRLLPGLAGTHHSFPFKITDRGLTVGGAAKADFSRAGAAVWMGATLHYLGTALPTDNQATLFGVAESGRAVGDSVAADGTSFRCIYWRPGHPLRVLPPLSGTWRTGGANAHYVSDDGLVGGNSIDSRGDSVPVVWPDADRLVVR